VFFHTTTPELNLVLKTQASSVSELNQFKNQEKKNNHKEITMKSQDIKERKSNKKLLLKKKTSQAFDCKYILNFTNFLLIKLICILENEINNYLV
jgi:hypothetical protein